MKTIPYRIVFLSAWCAAVIPFSTTFAQGLLTPPGAPAPTMKTLTQMEPRTAITNTASAVTISQPGSYYLTGNLTVSSGDAINITGNNVTLDLNGFTISSTAASAAGDGILLSALIPKDITIMNGHIVSGVTNNGSGIFSGSGFANGIGVSLNVTPANIRVVNISVSGCLYDGIDLSLVVDSTEVEGCTVRTVGNYGIVASVVKNCIAYGCGDIALYGSQISDCHGRTSGSAQGINASVALNCYGYASGPGDGIAAYTAQNCYGYALGNGNGLVAGTAQNCYGVAVGTGDGFHVIAALNCYGQSSYGKAFVLNGSGTMTGCSANGMTGISSGNHCIIKDCAIGFCTTNGIVTGTDSLVSDCTVGPVGIAGTNGIGISTGARSTIRNCTVNSCRNDGILVTTNCAVLDNNASGNGAGVAAAGIHATGPGNRIEGNQTRNNIGHGIKSDGGAGADVIIRNTAGANTVANYTPTTGATFGPIQTISAFTNAMGNVSF